MRAGVILSSVEDCVDKTIERVGHNIVLGAPLGLGKPNLLINAFYRRAKANPEIKLKIMTALTLEKPKGKSFLEKNFLTPFVKRVFGNYPDLDYEIDRNAQKVPANIEVIEFYFPAGKFAKNSYAQQNYVSCNYTHVARDMMDAGINVLTQMISKEDSEGLMSYSLSCNPDVTLDLVPMMIKSEQETGNKVAILGDVNKNLPYMYGDAEVPAYFFHYIIDNESHSYTLFGPPKMAVTDRDFMIGVFSSALIKDGGCLQVGIGALGDAVVHSMIMRHQQNKLYQQLLNEVGFYDQYTELFEKIGDDKVFIEGLFGATEMLVDGFMHLLQAKILKKKVYNNIPIQTLVNEKKISEDVTPNTVKLLLGMESIHNVLSKADFNFLQEFGIIKQQITFNEAEQLSDAAGNILEGDLRDPEYFKQFCSMCLGEKLKLGRVVHAGFFLGCSEFYQSLNAMTPSERRLIDMTSVGGINQLYWSEKIDTLQRHNARFINTCLMVTLSGAVVSDGLEDGTVISGVGGQYNFVAMAHAIENGRSIIKCRSTRISNGKEVSNIVFHYGHITIPRHLRDIVITEYGIADLRGKTDSEIIKQLLNIADSRFQMELLQCAIQAGKINKNYTIPDRFTLNHPHKIVKQLKKYKEYGLFNKFPFGTDFSPEEQIIGAALKKMKIFQKNKMVMLSSLWKSFFINSTEFKQINIYLDRMGLLMVPKILKHKILRRLLALKLIEVVNAQ